MKNRSAFSGIDTFLSASKFSTATKLTYSNALRTFHTWCRSRKLSFLSEQDIYLFRQWLLEKYRLTTAQTYMAVIKQYFSWLSKNKSYDDIALDVRGVRIDHSEPMRNYLSGQKIKRILDLLSEQADQSGTLLDMRNYMIVLLMATCGLRISEVKNLDVGDFYRSSETFRLLIHGKGRDGKADSVNVPEYVVKKITHWLKMRQSPSAVFPMFTSMGNNNKDGRLCSRSVSQIVKQAMITAGFNSSRLTAHSLRHSAVTLALLAGASLQEVQQFARHRRIETTQMYAHNLEAQRNRCSQLIIDMIRPEVKRKTLRKYGTLIKKRRKAPANLR